MRSICEVEYFGQKALNILERAELAVAILPNDKTLRCHEVARAVGGSLGLDVVDGKFGAVDHSWCAFVSTVGSNPHRFILDVYAVGRLPQVQLIDASSAAMMGLCALFRPGQTRDDINVALVQSLQARIHSSPHMQDFISVKDQARALLVRSP